MKKIGIIAEYNPFHNGHLYQIEKIKELYNPDLLVSVISGNFSQRGEFSSINKFHKAKIAVENGIDLCVELPLIYTIQSADYFAYYSVYILNMLNVDIICAGSEINDVNRLYEISEVFLSEKYNEIIKKYIDLGNSYKVSSNLALNDLGFNDLGPNDTLNICYINAIKKINKNIKFETIKRTVSFDSNETINNFASASFLRNSLNLKEFVPKNTFEYYNSYGFNSNDLNIDLIKYSLLNCDFNSILNMTEGLDGFLKKIDLNALNLPINSKRYSSSRINRILISILLDIKKQKLINPDYVRVLSMNNLGKNYLNIIKKDIKIYTNIKNGINNYLDLEIKASRLYSIKKDFYKLEFNNPYIIINQDK